MTTLELKFYASLACYACLTPHLFFAMFACNPGRNTDSCVPRMDVKPVNVSEGVIYRTIIFVGFIFNFIDFSGPGLYYRLETAYGI